MMLRTQCAAIRAGEWRDVNETLAKHKDWSVGEYRAMLQAASQVVHWQGALQIVDHMERSKAVASSKSRPPKPPRPQSRPLDAAALGHAIAACARAGRVAEATRVLERLQASGTWPEVRSYNMVITCHAKRGRWREALALLDGMFAEARDPAAGPAPTVVSCNAALAACSRARRWEEALALLSRMQTDGPEPDVVSYSTAATACQRAEQWAPALHLLRAVNETDAAAATAALAQAPPLTQTSGAAGLDPQGAQRADVATKLGASPPRVRANPFTYTAAVTALAGSGRWREALEAYDRIPQSVPINEVMLNAAVGAAASGDDWRRCVDLLEAGMKLGLTPRTSSFNMALLVEVMPELGLVPSPACFLAASRACAAAGEWRGAMRLWQMMMRNDVRPHPEMWQVLLGACREAGDEAKEETQRLLQFAEREGVPLMALEESDFE